MDIAIVDNEEYYAYNIQRKINAINKDLFKVDVFYEGNVFLEAFRNSMYDLVYLDIELNDAHGMNLAYEIKHMKEDVMIIFITAHMDYCNEEYLVNALQYLLKPINRQLFVSELERAFCIYQEKNQKIMFKTHKGTYFIPINDIVYIETSYKEYKLYTINKIYYGSLKQLADVRQKLCERHFMKTHRSYTVNLNHIVKIVYQDIYMTNGKIVPLARSQVKEFQNQYAEHMYNK